MAGEKHLYLVAKGSYEDSSLSAETWQTGIRLWADISVPDDQGNLPTTGDYASDSGSSTEGDWDITWDWQWTTTGGTVIVPHDYLNDQAGPAFAAFFNAAYVSAKTRCDSLTLYPMLATGRVFEARKAVLTYHTGPPGTDSSNMLPPEVSCCLSLQTPQVGRRGRGRMYMPPAGTGEVSSQGFVSSGHTAALATAGATLMAALAVESIDPSSTHVRPIVTGVPYTRYGVVESVNVGNVWDAQRRRRRQLIETRTDEAVTYG